MATTANDAFLISVSLLERMLRTWDIKIQCLTFPFLSPPTVEASSPHPPSRPSGLGLGLEISGLDAAITADEPDQPGSDRRGKGRSLGRARPALAGVLGQPLSIGLLDPLSGLLSADHRAVVICVPVHLDRSH